MDARVIVNVTEIVHLQIEELTGDVDHSLGDLLAFSDTLHPVHDEFQRQAQVINFGCDDLDNPVRVGDGSWLRCCNNDGLVGGCDKRQDIV